MINPADYLTINEEGEQQDGLPAPPDDLVIWKTIKIKGNHLVAKDAVTRHDKEEKLEDWPHVAIEPGSFSLSLRIYRDEDGAHRVSLFRIAEEGSSPIRGEKLELEMEVDFALASFCDYDLYIQAVKENEDDYEEYADELFDLMERGFGEDSFKEQTVYFVPSGFGDGEYPVFSLTDESGRIVGLECDFSDEE